MDFFNIAIKLFFWVVMAGSFLYGVLQAMALAKSLKNRNAADQEDSTYGIGVAAIIFLIGMSGAAFFPAIPTF